MSAHKEEMIELCAAYALGTIDERDRRRLEAHLAEGCAECEAALGEFGRSATLLAASAPRVLPLPVLRDRVLRGAGPEPATPGESPKPRAAAASRNPAAPSAPPPVVPFPRRGRPAWFAWIGWALAALLLITSGTFYESSGRLRAILRLREADLNGTARDLAVERQWNGVLTSPNARVADLAPAAPLAGEGSGTRGRAVYDPATRRAVVVLMNASLPDSQCYQLWALRGLSPTSLGVIRTDEHGAAVLRLESAGEPTTLTGFAVSLEAKGGSPHPNAPGGPIVLLGTLRETPRALPRP